MLLCYYAATLLFCLQQSSNSVVTAVCVAAQRKESKLLPSDFSRAEQPTTAGQQATMGYGLRMGYGANLNIYGAVGAVSPTVTQLV